MYLLIGLHVYGLSNAASGYHKVLEENRKLYNQVQDLKGNFSKLDIFFFFFFEVDRIEYIPVKLIFILNLIPILGSIRVYCRVRPFLPGQLSSNTVGSIDDGNIAILTPSRHGKEARRTFCFNKVFGPSSTQGTSILCFLKMLPCVRENYVNMTNASFK